MQIVQQEKPPAPPDETVQRQPPAIPPVQSEPAFPDLQHHAPVKELKTANDLAAMIINDLQQVNGCPVAGVNVTVHGLVAPDLEQLAALETP
jgi:hypothetical protein